MKYIKSINEYYNNSEYYTVIDKSELRKLYNADKSMDSLSVKVLNKFLDSIDIDYTVFNNDKGYQIMIEYVYNEKIIIYPCDNDWFLCCYSFFKKKELGNIFQSGSNVSKTDYKCDQIEGVIKLIKDILEKGKKEEPKEDSSNKDDMW